MKSKEKKERTNRRQTESKKNRWRREKNDKMREKNQEKRRKRRIGIRIEKEDEETWKSLINQIDKTN